MNFIKLKAVKGLSVFHVLP